MTTSSHAEKRRTREKRSVHPRTTRGRALSKRRRWQRWQQWWGGRMPRKTRNVTPYEGPRKLLDNAPKKEDRALPRLLQRGGSAISRALGKDGQVGQSRRDGRG